MKNLKIKSILCGLMIIATTTFFLTSCESDFASLELKESTKELLLDEASANVVNHKKVIKLGKANSKSSSGLTLVIQSENEALIDQLTATDFEIQSISENSINDFEERVAKKSNYEGKVLDIDGMDRVEIEIIDNDNSKNFKGYEIKIKSTPKTSGAYFIITTYGGKRSQATVYNNSNETILVGNSHNLCGVPLFKEFELTESRTIAYSDNYTFQINSNDVQNNKITAILYDGHLAVGYTNPGNCTVWGSCYYELRDSEIGLTNKTTSKMALFAAKQMKESIHSITGLYLSHKQELLELHANNAKVKQAVENYYDTYVQIANNDFSKNPSVLTKADIEATIKLLAVIEANSSEQLQNSVGRLKQEVRSFEGKTLTEGFEAFNSKHE